eukprot:GHVL01032998.1.p1 GENE.GHVL01032998.1~~GHVL01032998.1.p1  ORF type:complete len:279 (+),score=23.27 GHVL01032998.1:63-899(+)
MRQILKDKEKMVDFITKHSSSIKAWGSFTAIVITLYFVFSDGDFSFLMTLSSLIGMFTFIMVVYKIHKSKSCGGVSLKMMECYLLLTFVRLCSIIPFEGYLPYDSTGDWLYQTVEALTFLLQCAVIYFFRFKYADTYDSSKDVFNPLLLIVPSAILAFFWHPSLNAFMPADAAWTFALYLESVCVFPQLWMFQKEGKVEAAISHFLAGQALSKALSFVFWASSHAELNDPSRPMKSYVGVWVIVMQIVQLILMGDFIYQYIKCVSKGVSVQFILNENV